MQSNCQNGMKWLAVYQDHGLKFAYMKALPDKCAVTDANFLMEFFAIQGAPAILRSDNGREFGGQGFTKCSCKGSCDLGRCTCKKKALCAEVDAITRCDAVTNSCVLTPH